MKKYLLFLIYLISFNTFAVGTLTHLPQGVMLYSEYYLNPTANFKGTIVFENGSGTDVSEWKVIENFLVVLKG